MVPERLGYSWCSSEQVFEGRQRHYAKVGYKKELSASILGSDLDLTGRALGLAQEARKSFPGLN